MGKKVFWGVLSFMICLLAFLLALRFVVPPLIVSEIGKLAGGTLTIGKIEGSLFSDLRLKEIHFKIPNLGDLLLRSVYLRYSLFSLLKKKKEIYALIIEEPRFALGRREGIRRKRGKNQIFLKVNKLTILAGRISSPPNQLGVIYFSGAITIEPDWVKISEGQLVTASGEWNGNLHYEVSKQKLKIDILSLSSRLGDSHFKLQGLLSLVLTKEYIFRIPAIEGEISAQITTGHYKGISIPSSSLTVKFQDSVVRYQLATSAQGMGDLRVDGFFSLRDTSYNLVSNFSALNLRRLFLIGKKEFPLRVVSGELSLWGRGRGRINFSSTFTSPDLRYDQFQVKGAVKHLFTKEGIQVVCQGKVLKEGSVLHFAGEFAKNGFAFHYRAEDFLLEDNLLNGEGEIRGNFDSLALRGNLAISQFSLRSFSVDYARLNFNFRNLFTLTGEGEWWLRHLKVGNLTIDSLNLTLRDDLLHLIAAIGRDTVLLLNGEVVQFILPVAKPGRRPHFSFRISDLCLRLRDDSIFSPQEFTVAFSGDSFILYGLLLSLAQGSISCDISLGFGKWLRGQIKVSNVELGQLLKDDGVKGILDATINSDTVVAAEIRIRDLVEKRYNVQLPEVKSQIIVRGNRIEIAELAIYKNEKVSHLAGYINLSKGKVENWELTATLNDPGPWVLSFLQNIFSFQEGEVFGKVVLKGNIKDVQFDGRVRIYKGRLFFLIPGITVSNLTAELSLVKDEIILIEAKGKVDKGEITGRGFVNLKDFQKVDTLHYDIDFDRLPLRYEEEIFALLNGQLSIDYTPYIPLRLSGNFSVVEGLITTPFGKGVSGKRGEEEQDEVEFNFKVSGEKGIWLRNKNADLELGVDLRVKKEGAKTTYVGELVTRKGELYYLDRTLKIKEGEIVFDNITEINPRLNLRAELETKPIKIGENPSQVFKIIFLLQGTLAHPEFKFLSEPPLLSEKDIITYLSLNISPEELKSLPEREEFFRAISERILSYFEREVVRKLRGYLTLDYLSLEKDIEGKGTRVTVGKYIGKNLYLTYSQVLAREESDEFKAEYYLTRKQMVVGEKTRDGRYIVRYQFQIRY